MTTTQVPQNFFNELDISKVAAYAIKLADKYNKYEIVIRRIVLYIAGNGFPVGTKYVMLLEISPGKWVIPLKKDKQNEQERIVKKQFKYFQNRMETDGGSAFLDESQ